MSADFPRYPKLQKLSRDAQTLVDLARSAADSSSRLEKNYWDKQLDNRLKKLLSGKKDTIIESALEHLSQEQNAAYEVLIEQIETLTESTQITTDGGVYDILLFSIPLILWTRYQLPTTILLDKLLPDLEKALRHHILTDQARLACLPQLVGFEQLPRTFSETYAWTQRLGRQALDGKTGVLEFAGTADHEGMLADARFLIGVIAVPHEKALFSWQEGTGRGRAAFDSRTTAFRQTFSQLLAPLFAGCTVDYLAPAAFHASNRLADQQLRPAALQAAITWLRSATNLEPGNIRAAIAACGHSSIEEYRIGLTTRHSGTVIYGCVWPVLSKEESVIDDPDSVLADRFDEITPLLKSLGITEIRVLSGLFSPDFCDDCGAPYFPNQQGEMMHPELPEEIDLTPISFH